MKKLIILTGALATGKSTFSKALSKEFNIPVLNKDDIKETLSDIFGFSSREENLRLSKATYLMMRYFLIETMKNEKEILLEANFHQEEIEDLESLIDEYNYDSLFLVFYGDTGVLFERFKKRATENRHKCHLSGPTTEESFSKYIDINNAIKYKKNCISIDANDFSYQNDSDLTNKIKSFLF